MAIKVFLCALIAALVAFSSEALEDAAPFDAWDDADALMVQLEELVDRARKTAQTQTTSISANIGNHARNTSSQAQIQVEEATQTVLRQLDNLQILADVLGASHCLAGRDAEMTAVSKDIVQDIQTCVTHIQIEAIATIVNISAHIARTDDSVKELKNKLADCSRETGDHECITVTTGEIHLAIDQLPSSILDETLLVLLLSKRWEDDIRNCADHQIGLVYSEGSRIIFDIESCLTAPPS